MVFEVQWTDQQLIDALHQAARAVPDGPLTTSVVQAHVPFTTRLLKRRLGPSWQQVLTRAGLQNRYSGAAVSTKMQRPGRRSLTDHEIYLELWRVAGRIGRLNVSAKDLQDHSTVISKAAVITRWGSFDAGIRAVGLVPSRFTHDDLMNHLHRLAVANRRAPTRDDADDDRERYRPATATYLRRYGGTWARVIAAYAAWTREPESNEQS